MSLKSCRQFLIFWCVPTSFSAPHPCFCVRFIKVTNAQVVMSCSHTQSFHECFPPPVLWIIHRVMGNSDFVKWCLPPFQLVLVISVFNSFFGQENKLFASAIAGQINGVTFDFLISKYGISGRNWWRWNNRRQYHGIVPRQLENNPSDPGYKLQADRTSKRCQLNQ